MSDQEQNRTPLAPSGASPFSHEVELSPSGSLALYWIWNREEHIRAFTPEETYNLLKFLEQHRAEIEASQTCTSCGKPIGQGGAIAELNHIRYCYCSDCHTNPFA